MHISPTEAKVVQAWHDAAADLKFRFTSPFAGRTAAGVSFEALGLVHHFGRRIGTIIQVGGEPSADADLPADDDYSWSCLGRTGYTRYARGLWIEMLSDWQYVGPQGERPTWYTREPR